MCLLLRWVAGKSGSWSGCSTNGMRCGHSARLHQLLRAKLYGFLPFEVVYRRAAGRAV